MDPSTGDYDAGMTDAFDALPTGVSWKIREILPTIITAGEDAGTLTAEGVGILDPTGTLRGGVPLAPPEGDAGTGMVATNSVRPRTGNVSAGTSVFAMIVLERSLSRLRPEIDIVLTPDGSPVAMAHSNNCTSEFDVWMELFGEAARVLGADVSTDFLYGTLMPLALEGDSDAGGIVVYPYVSGEHVTGFSEGRPLLVRPPDRPLTLANVVRAHLFGSLGALRAGLDILTEDEGVAIEEIRGHGGFFKTPGVGQRIMAAATRTPVSVLETAGEGGAWGMALLAAFAVREDRTTSLPEFLDRFFATGSGGVFTPTEDDIAGFNAFHARYRAGLPIERTAVEHV